MIKEVEFFDLFPDFKAVPDNIGQSRMMPHLTRERYSLKSLNYTHHEWEREAIDQLRSAGYIVNPPVWQADPGSPDHGHFRKILCGSPESETLRVVYFLGPMVELPPVPSRLKKRFLNLNLNAKK